MPVAPATPPRLLTQSALASVVCPVCHAALQLESTTIRCTGCARRYPIVDGLPVLLAERAL